MPDINFTQIPGLTLTPGVYMEFDPSNMLAGLPRPRTRTLVAGQKLSTGSAIAGRMYRVVSAVQAKLLFGRGSMLAIMLASYFANDSTTEVWAVGLADNAGGTAGTGTFAFTGPATAAGTLALMVGDTRIKVPVTATQSATSVGAAVAAAINALPDLPVTAANSSGTVTVTARHKGAAMNGYYLGYNYDQGDALPAGLGLTALTVGAVVIGVNCPDATEVFTAIGEEMFATLVHPWTDAANFVVIEAQMKARAGAMKMNYGMAYSADAASYANLITLGAAVNSEYSSIVGIQGSPTPDFAIAAAVAGRVTEFSRNNLGCPFTGLALTGILAPAVADRFIRDDRQFLLEAGISTLKLEGGNVVIERMVTTRKTNAQGLADAGLRNVNTMLIWFYLSWSQQYVIASKFKNYKLGDDGGDYSPGARVATPSQIQGELVALAVAWHQAGLIENLEAYKQSIRVVRNADDRDRVDSFQRPDFINEFNVLASLVQPIL